MALKTVARLVLTSFQLTNSLSGSDTTLKKTIIQQLPRIIAQNLDKKELDCSSIQSEKAHKFYQKIKKTIPQELLEEIIYFYKTPQPGTSITQKHELVSITPKHGFGCTASHDVNKIEIFNLANEKKQHNIKDKNVIRKAVISPHGKYMATLASNQNDQTIKIWDVINEKALQSEQVHALNIEQISFLNNETLLIADTNRIWVWNFNNRTKETVLEHSSLKKRFAFMKERKKLIYSESSLNSQPRIHIMDLESKKVTKQFHTQKESITHLVANDLKGLIASVKENDNTVFVWDSTKEQNKEFVLSFTHPTPIKSICFDPAGNYLVCSTNDSDHSLYFWDIAAKKNIFKYDIGEKRAITFLSWAEDNSMLIAQKDDKETVVWDGTLFYLGHQLEKVLLKNDNQN